MFFVLCFVYKFLSIEQCVWVTVLRVDLTRSISSCLTFLVTEFVSSLTCRQNKSMLDNPQNKSHQTRLI